MICKRCGKEKPINKDANIKDKCKCPEIKDGGPAFPKDHGYYDSGMSLRDYFAAKSDISLSDAERYCTMQLKISNPTWEDIFAARSFLRYADSDAMLEAREK